MRRTSRDRTGVRGGADRVRRDWGRVVSVRKRTAGRPVTAAAAVGATTIGVRNGVLFGDRGSVKVGDQVTRHTGWNETTGLLTIVDPLVAALAVGDRVFVYDRGRDTVVTDLEVLVDRDDDAGAPLPVYANAGMVTVLPVGPREPEDGEVVQIEYDPDDEAWSIINVPGLADVAGMKAEANDTYILTTADKTAGFATIPLTYVPVDESVKLTFGSVPQRPSNYTVNYDAKTITFPLAGWEPAGLRFWVHYWYVRGPVPAPPVSFRGQDTAAYTSVITSPLVVSPVDAGAVQGDVFVLAVAATGTTTFSDPRIVGTITMPDTDFDLVWGRLTTIGATNWDAPFSVSTDSSTVWGAAVALACYEAGDVTQIAGPGTSGTSPISLPTVASAAFVVGVVHLQNGFAAGTELSETGGGGYTRACFAQGTKVSVAIFHKVIAPTGPNPASAFTASGSLGTLNATTLVVTP